VLAVLLALIAAVSYGFSDFSAGLATRGASVIRVTLLSEAFSVAVVAVALAVIGAHPPSLRAVVWGCLAGLCGVCGALALYLGFRHAAFSVAVVAVALAVIGAHPPSLRAVVWGCLAGLCGVCGALALYLGFRHAAFSVAGPLSAVGAAGFSVLAGLLLGERPTALALTGIVLALPAIVAVSASVDARAGEDPGGGVAGELAASEAPAEAPAARRRRRIPAGVSYGLVAGAGFAFLFIGLDRAGSSSGLWPVFCSQAAALVAIAGVAAFTGDLRLPGRRGAWLSAATGLTGAPGTILYFLATHRGLLAIVAVITSLYPAVTILLARVMLGERLTRIRLAGLILAAASVTLIAVSGAG
jgi:drug/metabolite transporter (DMT)-like permease